MELRIDPEFRDKIPPLTEDEFKQLEENILSDNEVYEPICVWNGTIVDGHNRWKIIQEHPSIPYRIKEMSFADKWEAFEWMYKKQLGRRNLTDEQKTYMIGKMYEARKKSVGNSTSRNADGTFGSYQLDQNDLIGSKGGCGGTAAAIGKEIGVAEPTVKRAEQFSKGVDKLKDISPEAASKVLNGDSTATKKTIRELPYLPQSAQEEIAQAIVSGEIKEKQKHKPSGWTKEKREESKLLDKIIEESYSAETKEFTITMLRGEIEYNGQNYVDLLRNELIENSTMLVGDNRKYIAEAVDNIIEKLRKVREIIS